MRNILLPLVLGGLVMLGTIGAAIGSNNTPAQIERFHAHRTIDQELNHLTNELELTPAQQKEIRALLLEHHQKIQALFDKNPSTPHEALRTQIHAISNETHHEIEALLTDHQKQLAKAMQARMHKGENSPRS
jgi:periplasmic protein CpxP/Spy